MFLALVALRLDPSFSRSVFFCFSVLLFYVAVLCRRLCCCLVVVCVFDVFLCYLYDPDETGSGGDFGDGTEIKVHRSRKMCAPMIPAGPTKMELFREYYQVQEVDFDALELGPDELHQHHAASLRHTRQSQHSHSTYFTAHRHSTRSAPGPPQPAA